MTIDTHGMICDFGRHKGKPYTRLPVSYLTWMVNASHSRAEIAQAELDRRGTIIPDLDISGHAIDKASLRCRKIWHRTSKKDEGLHAWLCRISQEALDTCKPNGEGQCFYLGMKLAFEINEKWPTLKTVMPAKPTDTPEEE